MYLENQYGQCHCNEVHTFSEICKSKRAISTITGSCIAIAEEDIIAGDVLKLIKLGERYEVDYECPETHRRRFVAVQPDMGGFKIVSEFPSNYVYSSVHEMALDFPQSVRVLQDVDDVKARVMLNQGDELVLKWIQAIGKDQFLVCQHLPSKKQTMLPCDLKGQFQRKSNDSRYTVKQLRSRMPVTVKRDIAVSEANLHGDIFLGIPEDTVMCLSVIPVVQVEHWRQPTTVQLCTGRGKTDMILKLDRGIMVAAVAGEDEVSATSAVDDYDVPYSHVQKLADVDKDSYAVVCGTGNDNSEKRITEGAHIVVCGHETKQGVILKGSTSYLLLPKDYEKETKFRVSWTCVFKILGRIHKNKAVLEPRVSPPFAITYFCNHCNIRFENTSKYVDTLTLFSKNLNQRSLTPR